MSQQKVRHKLYRRNIAIVRWQGTIARCTSLDELLSAHKGMWAEGVRCRNLGPDRYGMFRTDDISTMTADEVYLGNIHGLWTHPVSFWKEAAPEDRYMITEQYRRFLMSNLKEMAGFLKPLDGETPKKTLGRILEKESRGMTFVP